MDCLFCKIAAGSVASDIIYQDDQLLAFSDIYPKAPIHKLIVPRKHIATLNEAEVEDINLLGEMILTAKLLAKSLEIDQTGYRLVFNTNADAGQMISHIHLHLIGGRSLNWPPG